MSLFTSIQQQANEQANDDLVHLGQVAASAWFKDGHVNETSIHDVINVETGRWKTLQRNNGEKFQVKRIIINYIDSKGVERYATHKLFRDVPQ